MTFTLSPFYLFTFLLFHDNLPRRAVGEANDVDTLLRFANHAPLDVVACNFCHFLRCHDFFNAVRCEGWAERLLFAIEGFTVCCLDKCHKVVLCIIVEAFKLGLHHMTRSLYDGGIYRNAFHSIREEEGDDVLCQFMKP